MNLCIDQGNSRTKIAVFDGNNIVFEANIDQAVTRDEINGILRDFQVENAILSSVVEENTLLEQHLQDACKNFICLNHLTPIPIMNTYQTPETLGKDRLAAVVGAVTILPEADLLVVDAGTAVTYDFVDASGVYHGGNIAPGIEMRLKALHTFTQKLPLVEVDAMAGFLGKDTQSAIQSGVLYGIVLEIDGYVERLMLKYPKLSVFLTGGSAVLFDNKLKSRIFADKNLVLTGLNRILQYNVK